MEYIRLLYQVPAVVSVVMLAAFLSPWQFRSRFTPLALFAAGLLVLSMPELPDMALCLVLAAGWLARLLGVDFCEREPLRVSLPVRRLRKTRVTRFVTSAFPAPEDSGPGPPAAAGSSGRSFVPPI